MKINPIKPISQAAKPQSNEQLTKAALKQSFLAKTHKAVKANAVALSTTNPLTPAEAVLEALGILAYLVFLETAANESGKPVPKAEIAKLLKQLQGLLPSIKGKFPKMAKFLQSMVSLTKTQGLDGLLFAFHQMLVQSGSEFNVWIKANSESLNNLNMISPELGFYISMLMISAVCWAQNSPSSFSSFFTGDHSKEIAKLLAAYIYQLPPPQGGQAGLAAFAEEMNNVEKNTGGGEELSSLAKDLQGDVNDIKKAGGIPSGWSLQILAGDIANDWDTWISKHYGE